MSPNTNHTKHAASSSAAAPLKAYDLSEVKKHNAIDDAWVTCGGYVHNITSFMTTHPGGMDYLIPYLGLDCEEAMEEHDHSSFSYALLKTFCIGTVKGQPQKQHHAPPEHDLRGYKPEELEVLVDFDKATLPQIAKLGDQYWPWLVNRPVVHDNKLIIFSNKFLESLSYYPWWYIWVLWTPVMLYNIYAGFVASAGATSSFGAALTTSVGSYIVGALMWSIMEYVLHRWVFHLEVFSNSGNVFHYFAHGIHHLIPTDSSRLTFPPLFAAVLGTAFFFLFRSCAAAFFTPAQLSYNLFYSGFILGYVMYDTMHYFFHHSNSENRIFKRLKAAHMNHHYKNEFANFGVSSPLWDFVFQTWDAEAGAKMK